MNRSIIAVIFTVAISFAVAFVLITPIKSVTTAYMQQKAELEKTEEYEEYQKTENN